MNEALVIAGIVILAVSVFGFSYTGQQQNPIDQAGDIVTGDQTDWELMQSLSAAGIVVGIVMVIVGAMPSEWYEDRF
jgi:hypothetical protein